MANPTFQDLNPTLIIVDYSITAGVTAQTVFANNILFGKKLSFMRIWNVSSTATIWLCRTGAAVINGAGSYPLSPLTYEAFQNPAKIPLNALSIIASAASTPVTIEVG